MPMGHTFSSGTVALAGPLTRRPNGNLQWSGFALRSAEARCLTRGEPKQMQRFSLATNRSADAPPPSLRSFLAGFPHDDILRIPEPMELDYLPTALILEMEKRQRTP